MGVFNAKKSRASADKAVIYILTTLLPCPFLCDSTACL